MPHPFGYSGGQDNDLTRSIDVVHIEPSIREGTFLVSSIYGTDASAPLRRYFPVNKVAPSISGDVLIPSTLTCDYGQWDASPAAQFAYQWIADGQDIAGATSQTWTSSIEFDGKEITCEVRGYNYLGENYAMTSNSIFVSLIEPIENNGMDFLAITGMRANKVQTMFNDRTNIITGLGSENAQSVNRSVAYFFTGRSADKRNDVNSAFVYCTTGLPSLQRLLIRDQGPSVISYPQGTVLETSVPQLLPLKNPNAELGIAGWEMFGDVEFANIPQEGEQCWFGGSFVDENNQNIPYSYLSQDVELYDIWHSEIDLGTCYVEFYWYQSSFEWKDRGNMKVEFLDAAKNIIGSDNGAGLFASRNTIWLERSFEALIPANTRFVRVYVEFLLDEGTGNDARLDNVRTFIRKGPKSTNRDLGPDFNMWRLNFTRANSYSGVALSELEFRATSGGADLATGGSPITGSEGNGGLASYAFDDLRSTGYWAGETNGVLNGTSWLGYDMGTPVRPQELDITARLGSDSFMMARDFTLQGSNDGAEWIDVQRYEDVGDFTSGQQRQFEVLNGSFDWYIRTSLDATNQNNPYVSQANVLTRGNIFRSKARFDINELSVYVTAANVDIRITIFKVGFELSRGIIKTPIDSYDMPTTASSGWHTQTLTNPYELEVGEYFAVVATDLNNPVDTRGRIGYWDPSQITAGTFDAYDGPAASREGSWVSNDSTFDLSEENGNILSAYFCVDFKGSIF